MEQGQNTRRSASVVCYHTVLMKTRAEDLQ